MQYVGKFMRKISKDKYLYFMILPGLVFMLLFRYIPMGGIIIAFKDFSFRLGIWNSEWVGLENFRFIFTQNPDFYTIVSNTIIINISRLFLGLPFAVILALLINEVQGGKIKKFIQSSVCLPHFVSWVIFGGIYTQFLSPSGFVNRIIELFGHETIRFMQEPNYFRGIVVASDIWKNAGWNTIIYLAALTSINQEMYEAAKIDGANRVQTALYPGFPPTHNEAGGSTPSA